MGREFDDGFTDFVVKWSPALLRVAFLLTSDRGEAEDLLQTALLKTSRHWSRLEDREAAYPYVRRVLVTTHASWRRRLSTTEQVVESVPDRPAAPHQDGDEELRAALRELPVRMRTAVVLRYFEDLSEQQTAVLMGCSPSTVNTQTARGLARLRTALTVLQPAGGDER